MTDTATTVDVDVAFAEIVAALGDMPEIVAEQTADAGTYKYRYADLASIMRAVRPVLAKHGLAVSQPFTSTVETVTVETRLLHRSGDTYDGGSVTRPAPPTPQQIGSLVTYLRRYALCALLGIAVDDDDGSSAAPTSPRVARTPRRAGQLTDAQTRAVMRLFGELGLSGPEMRDDRLSLIVEIIGREIDTTKDVTRDEASLLIDELSARVDAEHGPDPE
jgi:hypothetical protein